MKKTVIIVVGLLLCVVGATVIGQKKNLSPKEERREVREKRRADRIASFEKTMDSVILSRNFQFNPQTMQRQPAGPMRQIMNPASTSEYGTVRWTSACLTSKATCRLTTS